MRILRSIRSINPADGGPIEGIKQVSRIHHEAGHLVEVVSLDAPGDPWVREFPLKVHALGPGRGKFGFTSELVRWLRREANRFDAVIVNGIWQFNSLGVFWALRQSPTPYFVFPHGMLDPWFKRAYPLKHLKKWLYWPWAEYRVLRNARAVCFTCEEERRLARQSFWLYRCRERVVGYGTAAPSGDACHQRRLFLERFPELQDKRLWLFMGRLHPKKGCDMLVRAFARVLQLPECPESGSPIHLVIAGPDQTGWMKSLERLAATLNIANRVTWTGMLRGDLKLGALRTAEALVLPSHQENFGLVVAEAMACEVPVLISDKVNIWREICEDEAGLVESDDEEGTFQLLARWKGLKAREREEFRIRAGRCFSTRFEIKSAADALIKVLVNGES
jgi:glycosyltransferase involved in cell wall biosynthesis